MSLYQPNENIPFTITHTDSGGTPVNATSITLKTRLNQNEVTEATPTNTGTGTYTATLTPNAGGWLEWRVETTYNSVDSVEEGRIKIEPGWFEDQFSASDYA
ncbi:MAG: hypothetical protein GY952_06720 [Rhodobacteraceae bacterium]|nr:hypothetical protein [Paracoccaceae bacterium]